VTVRVVVAVVVVIITKTMAMKTRLSGTKMTMISI
jgi:hypothetical protein